MKIVGSDKGLHSPEFHKKKTRERRIKQAVGALVALVVVAVPIYLARTHRFLISSVQISGNEVTKSETIERIVTSDLAGNYAWIFPRSNAALYPKQKIVNDLMARIPRLLGATVELIDARTLKVTVDERSPAALYCLDISDVTTPSGCYFVDDNGQIFSEAPSFSGGVYLIYATEEPMQDPIGKQVLPKDAFQKSRDFVKMLGTVDIYPKVFLIKDDEEHAVLANGAEVMWKAKSDPDTLILNLQSFFSEPNIVAQPHFLDRILYLDLRFDGKIFYKFRE